MNAPNQPTTMTPPTGPRPVANGRPQSVQAPSRMTLGAITRGRVQAPLRVLCYGVEGVGKSTLGADAPDPVFLGTEDGTAHLDVARFRSRGTGKRLSTPSRSLLGRITGSRLW